MNRRTIIGIVCLVVSLLLFFLVFPLLRGEEDATVSVFCALRTVGQGEEIDVNYFEVVSLHADDVPENALTEWPTEDRVYAKVSIVKGAFVQSSMLTTKGQGAEEVLSRLEEGEIALSIPLSNMAAGVSGKLKNGDIVSLYTVSGGKVELSEELSALTVITTTTSGGVDADQIVTDENGKKTMPSTLTLLVNEKQAKKIIEAEASGDIYVALVRRGGENE